MALAALTIHWVLLFGYGLALNDSGGSDYCELTMASFRHPKFTPWTFNAIGMFALIILGVLDSKRLHLHSRLAFYPIPLFLITQLIAIWLLEAGTRY